MIESLELFLSDEISEYIFMDVNHDYKGLVVLEQSKLKN